MKFPHEKWENGMLWLFGIGVPHSVLTFLVWLTSSAWEAFRRVFLGCLVVSSLILAGCGINPAEGEFGPVEVVPEQDTCWVKVRYPAGNINYEPRLCAGGGHDVEIFGRRW
jgi:hypothetical protein